MAIVNEEKYGNNSANTLVNNKKGYTYMSGLKGNDTYVIEDIANSYTEIDDSDRLDECPDYGEVNENLIPTTDYGTDTIQIKNVKPNELALFFDVALESLENPYMLADALVIVKKSLAKTVLEGYLKGEELWDYYYENHPGLSEEEIEEQIMQQAAPQKGAVYIPYHFGDTNNGGIQMSASAIEKIQIVNTETDEIITLDIAEYMANVKQQVEELLLEVAELGLQGSYGTKILSAVHLLTSEHTEYINRLIDIYKSVKFDPDAPDESGDEGSEIIPQPPAEDPKDDPVVPDEPGDEGSEIIPQPPAEDPKDDPVIEVPANVLLLKKGDGNSVLIPKKGTIDTLRFDGFNTWNDVFFECNKNDLIIHYGEDNSVTIKNYFKNPYTSPIQYIEFTNNTDSTQDIRCLMTEEIIIEIMGTGKNSINGTKLDDDIFGTDIAETIKAGDGDDYIWGAAGDDKLYGGSGQNAYFSEAGDGNDVVYYDKKANDAIFFEDVDFNELHIEKGKYNGIKIVTTNGNSFELANYLKTGKSSVSEIYASSFTNSTTLEEFLEGKRIYQYGDVKNNKLTGTSIADEIYGGAGNDTIKAAAGDDILVGGAGDDKLYGGAGRNEYQISAGDGNDVVYYDKNASNDVLNFTDARMNELHIEKGKYNGIKIVNQNGDSFELASYLKKGKTSVAEIHTGKDGQTQSLADFLEGKRIYQYGDVKNNKLTGTSIADEIYGGAGKDTLQGKAGNDYLYGEAGNDTLKGGDGNDYLYGGIDNDKLYGEAGHNTFYFSDGDGKDTIYMGKGVDKIVFDDSVTEYNDDLVFVRNKNNLEIRYGLFDDNGERNSVTVMNYFKSKYQSVQTVQINGEDYNLKDIVIEGKVNNFSYGVPVKEYVAKDDIVENNNLMYIDGKNNLAYGGYGDDMYQVSSLKNNTYIEDESGDDRLIINEKSSNINVLFDVYSDGTVPEIGELSSILIMNDANLKKFMKNRELSDVTSGIEISRCESAVEEIYSKDGKMINVEQLQNDVASWLNSNGYYSAMQVIYDEHTAGDMESLLAVYQNAWENV